MSAWPPWFDNWLHDDSQGCVFRPLYVELTTEQMEAADLDAWIVLGGHHERLHDSAPGGAIRLIGSAPAEQAKMPIGPRWHRSPDLARDLLYGRIGWKTLLRMTRDPDMG